MFKFHVCLIANIFVAAAVCHTTTDLATAGDPETSIDLTTAAGSPGCTVQHEPYADGESRNFSIVSSGRTRTFRVHLPLNYDHAVQHPLMISYHGGTET